MTIKELSKECNVHYNTMRKWLVDNNVDKTGDSRNSKFDITDNVRKKAVKHFSENLKPDSDIDKENYNNEEFLREQINVKDDLILKQQTQIEHLQKIIENQQILTLNEQNKSNLIEVKNTDNVVKKRKFWRRNSD